MRVCRECHASKPVTEFYANRPMPDGYLRTCKDCQRRKARLKRLLDGEVLRERDRQRQRPTGNKYRTPEQQAAHNAVARAIANGDLVRPSVCEICDEHGRRIEAAHFNYTERLRVRWLCARCHRRWDQGGPETRSALNHSEVPL